MTVTLNLAIDEDAPARFQAVAAPDENFEAFIADVAKSAVRDALMRLERQAAGRAEMQAMLDGPRRRFDSEATYQAYREKYGWDDVSHLSREEVEERWDALLDASPPEKGVEAGRLAPV